MSPIYVVVAGRVDVDGVVATQGQPVWLEEARAASLVRRGLLRAATDDELRLHGLLPAPVAASAAAQGASRGAPKPAEAKSTEDKRA